MADDFVDQVATASAALARHRKSAVIEPRDALVALAKNWNIRIPGFESAIDVRPMRTGATRV